MEHWTNSSHILVSTEQPATAAHTFSSVLASSPHAPLLPLRPSLSQSPSHVASNQRHAAPTCSGCSPRLLLNPHGGDDTRGEARSSAAASARPGAEAGQWRDSVAAWRRGELRGGRAALCLPGVLRRRLPRVQGSNRRCLRLPRSRARGSLDLERGAMAPVTLIFAFFLFLFFCFARVVQL
jgi:hypothetical protein